MGFDNLYDLVGKEAYARNRYADNSRMLSVYMRGGSTYRNLWNIRAVQGIGNITNAS